MKKITVLLLMIMGFFTFQSCDQNKPAGSPEATEEVNEEKMPDDDAEFITEAASGGIMEVQLGYLAVDKANTKEVKDFGQKMVDDHGKANKELIEMAKLKGITLPTKLSDDQQKKIDELTKKTGLDFDKAYMDEMVEDHKHDVDEFEEAAKDSKDADIKDWAAKTAPHLKMHLDLAKSTHEKIKDMK